MFISVAIVAQALLQASCLGVGRLAMGDRQRDAKLRKLDLFRRKLPHMSAQALSSVLAAVEADGVPEIHARSAFREARDVVNDSWSPFGQMQLKRPVHAMPGGPATINLAHPFALLYHALTSSSEFNDFFRSRIAAVPPSLERPWQLILYSDEVTPGNPLSTSNERKLQAVYFSFVEFGANALSKEESWFTVMAERSTHIKKIYAGMSQAFGLIIKMFFDDAGANVQTGGVELPLGDRNVRLFAKLGVVVQDGGAHKMTWHARGDGALKLCLLCQNLFTEESRLCDEDACQTPKG